MTVLIMVRMMGGMVATPQAIVELPQIIIQVVRADHHTHQAEQRTNMYQAIHAKMERMFSHTRDLQNKAS